MVLVPAVWFALGRKRVWRYPFDVDILVVLPFAIDMAGNAANLYDTIDWWDDANHFVNWAILTGAVAVGLAHVIDRRWEVFWLIVGFGAATAILWEIGEYFAFIRHSKELKTAYTDTLGDLTLGLSGSVLTATIAVALRSRRAGSSGARAAGRGSSAGASSTAPS